MEFGFYSFSEQFGPGIDFYTVDEPTVNISIAIESNVVTNITKIVFAQSAISITSDVTTTPIEILFAQVSIVADGATLTVGTRVKLADAIISANSDLQVSAIKIASATSDISGSADLTAQSIKFATASVAISATSDVVSNIVKIAKASIVINPTSDMTIVARRVVLAASVISGNVNLTVVGDIFLITARIAIFNNTNIVAQAIKFSSTADPDFSLIRSLLMLDGVPLTNQNRRFDVAASPIYIENINWQGDSSRYFKNSSSNAAAKRTFNLQWSFIPNYENKTVDLRASRNFLSRKSKDADVHTLTIIKQDENGITPYTEENIDVLITNYSENLVRRDLANDVYYFDCAMSLQEV